MFHLHTKVINILAFAKFICALHHTLAPQQDISLCSHRRILAFPDSSALYVSSGFIFSRTIPTLFTSIPVPIFNPVSLELHNLLSAFKPF